MSCEKHGYTNNVYCPMCDLETIERNEAMSEAKRDTPEAWADDVPLLGDMAPKNNGHIKHLIEYLLTVYNRFGNTAVTADLQWGASALWKRDEQKERIDDLERRLAAVQAGETEVLRRLDALLAENAAKAATITLANADIAALREEREDCRKMLEGEHDAHMECHARAEAAERRVAELEAEKQAMVDEVLSMRERSRDIERRIAEVEAGAKEMDDALFGCFVSPSADGNHTCAICDESMPILTWTKAPHADGCIINAVRDRIAAREKEKSNG